MFVDGSVFAWTLAGGARFTGSVAFLVSSHPFEMDVYWDEV